MHVIIKFTINANIVNIPVEATLKIEIIYNNFIGFKQAFDSVYGSEGCDKYCDIMANEYLCSSSSSETISMH